MKLIQHRVNTIQEVKGLDPEIGVEIDVRAMGTRLILNHEPFEDGDNLEEFLVASGPRFVIFNIKEAGIESAVISMAEKHGITEFFLLDVEFPYVYRASRAGESRIAIRYSEDESIETVKKYAGKVDWVWIDTNTELPLRSEVLPILKEFKTCLVCPERWGRPEDISSYKAQMQSLNFELDAVMTGAIHLDEWKQ